MNTVSPDLSRELFEVSGLLDPEFEPRRHTPSSPYYSLGFLVRKMPRFLRIGDDFLRLRMTTDPDYYQYQYGNTALNGKAVKPEDAAARVLIKLYKQNFLTKDKV